MAISLYEGRKPPTLFVQAFAFANVAFSILVLFAWPMMGKLLAEVMTEAIGRGLDPGRTPEYKDYAFAILWMPPLIAVLLAWAAQTAEMHTLAKCFVAYPLTLIAICFFWYHFGRYYLV